MSERHRWSARTTDALVLILVALTTVLVVAATVPMSAVPPSRGATSAGPRTSLLPTGLSSPTLSITGTGPASVSLSWTATSDLTFSEYEIQDSTSSSTGPWSTAGTLSSQSDTSFYATGLTPGQSYWWQVVEVDVLGVGLASNALKQVQPSAATLTATTQSPSSVQLSWTNHASYGGAVAFDEYVVKETPSAGTTTTLGTITSESTMSATAAGLTAGTAYTFQVDTVDTCSGASNCGSSGPTSSSSSNAVNVTPASTAASYAVTFTETGLSSGASWSVALGGTSRSSNGTSIGFTETNGTYSYSVGGVSGYTSSPSSGSVLVSGSAVTQSVSFTTLASGTFSVTFTETGLPASSAWWVSLNGTTQHSTGTTITFTDPNGSYAYTPGGPSGYVASPTNGSITVAGASLSVTVSFSYSSGGSSGSTGSSNASIDHVVLIMLENQEVTDLWKSAPYERYLAATYGNATNFYATCHSSTSLYLAVTSGNTFGCKSISANPGINVTHLGDLLDANGLTWMAYQESMPAPCDTTSSGTYLDYHDPFMFYQDVSHNKTRCDTHVVNSAYFNSSLANGTLPTFSFYTPNYVDDGHGPEYSPWNATTGLPHIEAFLKAFLPPILNHTGRYATAAEQAVVNHTAFVLLYDEGVSNQGYTVGKVYTPGCYNQTGLKETACGGHVQVTVISPYSLHRTYTSDATTYNVQSTIEWLFGLPSDGGMDGNSNFPPMKSLFSFTSNGFGQGRGVASGSAGAVVASSAATSILAFVLPSDLVRGGPSGPLLLAAVGSVIVFPATVLLRRRFLGHPADEEVPSRADAPRDGGRRG